MIEAEIIVPLAPTATEIAQSQPALTSAEAVTEPLRDINNFVCAAESNFTVNVRLAQPLRAIESHGTGGMANVKIVISPVLQVLE